MSDGRIGPRNADMGEVNQELTTTGPRGVLGAGSDSSVAAGGVQAVRSLPIVERLHLLGATDAELTAWAAGMGLEKYRAEQIRRWVFERGVSSFDEMTNLSKAARAACAAQAEIWRGTIAAKSIAPDGTTKLLIRWPDGAAVEAVWIPDGDRHTACISSQVGCPVGCRFCASGLNGVERNLTAGEIVEQAMWVRGMVEGAGNRAEFDRAASTKGVAGTGLSGTAQEARKAFNEEMSWDQAVKGPSDQGTKGPRDRWKAGSGEVNDDATPERSTPGKGGERVTGEGRGDVETEGPVGGVGVGRLSNIVLMGMGEPLANYEAVVKAVRIMNSPGGMGIGARKITLSTVGLPAQIRRLASEGLQINLALSLHAPEDGMRQELIPWGKGVRIAELVEACRLYFEKTGREVTLEYVLLEGVNTLPRHAEQLAGVAKRLRCNVNLLRYNPVEGTPYSRPSAASAQAFLGLLRSRGVNAHVRKSRGREVDAACGQLRREGMRGEHAAAGTPVASATRAHGQGPENAR